MQQIIARLEQQLQKRALHQQLRKLPQELAVADFYSNDYLGLARNKKLAERIATAAGQEVQQHGATGSRLISGNAPLTEAVESELAHYFQAQACLLYTSGYAANQGVLSALLQRGDTVLYDELSHACIKDGCRLSSANRFSFRHNDLDHLRSKLARTSGPCFVVVESVYSMDGDEAPLAALAQLCRERGAGLIVDEAHSTGLWGLDGAGSCLAQGVAGDVLARIHTFGKAMGVHGACVAGSALLIRYLINFSRTFIYTTALPPHAIVSIREAVRFRQQQPQLAEQLFRQVGLFRWLMQEKAPQLSRNLLPARGPIQALLVPGSEQAVGAARQVQAKGYGVWPILSPTVPSGQERLRICLHSFNSQPELEGLVDTLSQLHL
ncbi:aminotransferase class I/II-fold pyridoxal phosphate-dependent enzyme [Cesiribacter andamanensis]|uniref:8-amino-7-oxononanoate synthase n=1 Tax=Cesiribacter andamanensis AMV16 TaxID=1279009 RepID=M7P2P3_9BACT|nr:8-amino-7-oxononanoate synthase [Cesiribacter andamanensis]EMR04814.1 8-amino-7-oxononanoate synthase [Cesiribacter andamanensis AMV16]